MSSKERVTISLCMIVKDEEQNLRELLPSVVHLFDEIIVVDTGSKDASRIVAERNGAQVFDLEWNDDFSAARNYSITKATGDYVFWLDADDRISPKNRSLFLTLKSSLSKESEPLALFFVIHNYGIQNRPATVFRQLRLFPRKKGIFFSGRVHEQIFPSLHKEGIPMKNVDIVIQHMGYMDENTRIKKIKRDLRILEKSGTSPFISINKANLLESIGDLERAKRHLFDALRFQNELIRYNGWFEKLISDLVRILVKQQDFSEARRILEIGLQCKPNALQLLMMKAEQLIDQHNYGKALDFLKKALKCPIEITPIATNVTEQKSHLYYLLARAHMGLNKLQAAMENCLHGLKIYSYNSVFPPLLRELSERFADHGNFSNALSALEMIPEPRTLRDSLNLACFSLRIGHQEKFNFYMKELTKALNVNVPAQFASPEEVARSFLFIAEKLSEVPSHGRLIQTIYDTVNHLFGHNSTYKILKKSGE